MGADAKTKEAVKVATKEAAKVATKEAAKVANNVAAATGVLNDNLHQLRTVSAVRHVIASLVIYILLAAVCIIPTFVWMGFSSGGSGGTQAALIMFGVFVLTFGLFEVIHHKELLSVQ